MNNFFNLKEMKLASGEAVILCSGNDGFNITSLLHEIKKEIINKGLNDIQQIYFDAYNTNGNINRFYKINFIKNKFDLKSFEQVDNKFICLNLK